MPKKKTSIGMARIDPPPPIRPSEKPIKRHKQ
jgi:hypothetical protein